MSTYYEALKLPLTASVAEIEVTIDAQYNYWRRLVTHHDPQTVQRANQALLSLEAVRSTLTDPLKRANYDAALGRTSGTTVSGLADPQLTASPLPSMSPPIPSPASTTVPSHPADSSERVDAWLCPQCGKANPIKSMYCQSCGGVLGQVCQQCQTVYEAQAIFCPSCGETPERVERRHKLQAQIQRRQTELNSLSGQTASAKSQTQLLDLLAIGALGWTGFMTGITLLFGPFSALRLLWSFLLSQDWVRTEVSPKVVETILTLLRLGTGAGRLVVWCVALVGFVLVMLNRRKFNIVALGAYLALSFIGILFSGANLRYYGYSGRNYALIFPALVTGGIAFAAALLLHKHERLVWPGSALGALLVAVVLCVSSQSSALSLLALIPQILLTFLTGLIGVRAWTIADLETQRAFELEATNAHRAAQLAREIEGLRQESTLLGTEKTT